MYGYCFVQLLDADTAYDIYQQILIDTFHQLPRFTDDHYRMWLFSIANHHVLGALKAGRRRHDARIDDIDIVDPSPHPDQRIDNAAMTAVARP